MNDTVNCPSCQRALRVPADLAGQDVKCPGCGTVFCPAEQLDRPKRPASPPVREREPEEDRPSRRDRDHDDRPSRRDRDYDDDRPSRRDRDYDRPSRRNLAPHRGALILVMGLLAVFVAAIPFGPIAWYLGNTDLAEIRAGRMDPEGEGMTQAGRIIGMITTILGIVGLLVACLVFCLIFGVAGTQMK
jgi:hypothetical protein